MDEYHPAALSALHLPGSDGVHPDNVKNRTARAADTFWIDLFILRIETVCANITN